MQVPPQAGFIGKIIQKNIFPPKSSVNNHCYELQELMQFILCRKNQKKACIFASFGIYYVMLNETAALPFIEKYQFGSGSLERIVSYESIIHPRRKRPCFYHPRNGRSL